MNHDHELDDKLHDDCPMCEEIRRRSKGVPRDKQRDSALDRYTDKAAKANKAVEEMRREQ